MALVWITPTKATSGTLCYQVQISIISPHFISVKVFVPFSFRCSLYYLTQFSGWFSLSNSWFLFLYLEPSCILQIVCTNAYPALILILANFTYLQPLSNISPKDLSISVFRNGIFPIVQLQCGKLTWFFCLFHTPSWTHQQIQPLTIPHHFFVNSDLSYHYLSLYDTNLLLVSPVQPLTRIRETPYSSHRSS